MLMQPHHRVGHLIAPAPLWMRHAFSARPHALTALERGDFNLDPKLTTAAGGGKIRCPHCRWQPNRSSRWMCAPAGDPEFFFHGCGSSWNTFDTRGLCPGCSYQWKHTSCLTCAKWSLHHDWYEANDGRKGKA
jgi:hypothetical protein